MEKLYEIEVDVPERRALIQFVMSDMEKIKEINEALNRAYERKGQALRFTNNEERKKTYYDPQSHSINISFDQIMRVSYKNGDDSIGLTLNRAIAHEIYHAQDVDSEATVQETHYRARMEAIQILARSMKDEEQSMLLDVPWVQKIMLETGARDLASLLSLAKTTPPPDLNKFKAEVENPAVAFSDSVMEKYYGEEQQSDYGNFYYGLSRQDACLVYREDSKDDDNASSSSLATCRPPRARNALPER